MPSDVSTALEAQNTEVSAGQLGAMPAVKGQQLNATISARSKLQTVEEFRNVVVKSTSDGAVVLLGDVARVELGSESYDVSSALNGKPAAAMGVQLAAGANALNVGEAVKAKLKELEPFYPTEMQLKNVIAYDTTPFVSLSIEEVVKSLGEAIVLVVLIMFLFLQNLRATLIPAITVPVVLLGTFGVLALFGYSINTLTMFAMVLAIGLLVDDAIVVVENVERVMGEQGLSALDATRQSMDEITSALVGIALVLSAVFIPMAFFWRLHRRYLPAVFGHHRLGHGALGTRRHDADAGIVRDPAQAVRWSGPWRSTRILRLVQPHVRAGCRGL
nr:hypothetical protein GCM10020185_64040 [Pseudomonas brassicacearum subsp. brassicacearum]